MRRVASKLTGVLALALLASGCLLDWSKDHRAGDASPPDDLDGGRTEGDARVGDGQQLAADGANDTETAIGDGGVLDGSTIGTDSSIDTIDAGPLPMCGQFECQHGDCTSDGLRCACPVTWTGTTCADDIDECANPDMACPPINAMQCRNTEGGFTCLGQLADWHIPGAARDVSELVANPDGTTTTDKITGLMWERMAPTTLYSFPDAESHCRGLALDNYTDWRIPTLIEYMSLYTRDPFPGTPGEALTSGLSGIFFTNSENTSGPGIWCLRMETGIPELCPSSAIFSATVPLRCVRTATIKFTGRPSERYDVDTANGVVKDTRTGLSFERDSAAAARTFKDADDYCKASTRAGRSWRLPTVVELMSTIDAMLSAPAASRAFGGAFAPTWSSTSKRDTPGVHMCVDLQSGLPAAYGDSATSCITRCVSN